MTVKVDSFPVQSVVIDWAKSVKIDPKKLKVMAVKHADSFTITIELGRDFDIDELRGMLITI